VSIFCALKANAQDYYITFAGTGASTTVSAVKVENLTSGTSLIVNGNDILHLTNLSTGVSSIEYGQSSELKIYPNPMTNYSTLEIFPPVAGDAVITVLDIMGKPVFRIQTYLESFRQVFRLAGIKDGFYLINVKSREYQFSGKLISNGQSNGTISIEKVNTIIQTADETKAKTVNKGIQANVDSNKNVSPTGWHVPSYIEWVTMENYLIANGYNYDGSTSGNKIALSLAATTSWFMDPEPGMPNGTGPPAYCNKSGFTAIMTGIFVSGDFSEHKGASWWLATELNAQSAFSSTMSFMSTSLKTGNITSKIYGYSVRCLKD